MSPTGAVSSFLLFATVTSMFVLLLPITEGKAPSRQCYFHGYQPGGNVPVIADVSTVPPEKFESTALDNVLDYFNKGGTAAVTTLAVIDSLGVALKGSPQVSAALGVVAVALGYASDSPSPNDILEKAMQSAELLAEEVSERMRQMQDYADIKVLELEKRIMTKNYKELFDKWAKCAEHRPGRDPNQCQQDAEEDITSARYHFQPLQDLFDAKQSNGKQKYDPNFSYRYVATWQWMKKYEGSYVWAPTYDEVKRLEVGLIPFRDYATLHLLVLEALANSFKEKQACASYKHTLDLLVEKSDYYVRYVKWAYEWIYIRQYEENMYFGVKGRVGGGPASAQRGGYLGTYKCSGGKCTIECSQMMKDNLCEVEDRSHESMEMAYKLCEINMGELKQAFEKFWNTVVLDVANRWEKYGEVAKERLAEVNC